MKKVITINLNGNAYQVDEDGYNALRVYLDRAEAQLKDGVDKAEVMSDLEQAVASKCAAFLNAHKTVVSGPEIAQILNEIGPVQGDGEVRPEPQALHNETGLSRLPRRLYRIREGSSLQGVCTGLAAFSDVDVAIVRLIFVLATFFSGIGLLVYIVLMFTVPVAYTEEELAAAYVRPPIPGQSRHSGCAANNAQSEAISGKRILPALLLCAVLGIFGAHRFYVGKVETGVFQLVTLGGLGVWAIIDFFTIAIGCFTDADGKKILRWA